jgi:hypothetical protein
MRLFIGLLYMMFCINVQALPVGILIGKIVSPLSKALTFEITYEGQKVMSKHQWQFFMLFIENFDYVFKAAEGDEIQNTVDYQVARPNVSYHLFELQWNGQTWGIIERLLPNDGRIPDSTIIVRCPANYVQNIGGGTHYQLPTVTLRDDIVVLAGSEKKLRKKCGELHVSSIHFATFQVPMREAMRVAGNRILIVPVA